EGGEGDLLLPVPPVFFQALDRVAALLRPVWPWFLTDADTACKGLEQVTRVHPDGLLFYLLGLVHANAGRLAEAAPAFRKAAERPSFVPVRRPALYALAFCQWELADRTSDRKTKHALLQEAVKSARRLIEQGNLRPPEAALVASVTIVAG